MDLESYLGAIWRNDDLSFYDCWNELLRRPSGQQLDDLGPMNDCLLLFRSDLFLVA
ncbi:unnamed protein product [Rodentolepis nana]|uniref:Uncharacterized protein n=1 Tax=Rodentolepis nana TaxID=102285 RepID=A0A3P7RVA3_RODNA|nr:unnamed protein product [Rodentolepis nana]